MRFSSVEEWSGVCGSVPRLYSCYDTAMVAFPISVFTSSIALRNFVVCLAASAMLPVSAQDFRVASFTVDVTIPLQHRCMGVLPTKSNSIRDPLEACGLVLLSDDKPVVIVAVDWCEIRNGAYEQWRTALAEAAGTSVERVLVSSLHQHDAPVTDSGAAHLLRQVGLPDELYHESFHERAVARVAAALKQSLPQARVVSHIGTGQARIEGIASSRRVVMDDGRVSYGRGSRSAGSEFFRNAPDGRIDPFLKTISFWHDDIPVAAISVYAVHPMSFYGKGEVSSDFVGLARRRRQKDLPDVMQIYASGCSGDVTAGKYNDGSEASRERLTDRLYDGMKRAWEATRRSPLTQLKFRSTPLLLEYYQHRDLEPDRLRKQLSDRALRTEDRILAAMGLSSHQRVNEGRAIDFPCVDFGRAKLLLFPGEAFVGYQLMAQEMDADSFVMSMGYGECWPGYIPLNADFGDRFHDKWLWVPVGSENRLRKAIQTVLVP